MKVKELIKALKNADQDLNVQICDTNGNIVEDIFTVDTDGEAVYVVFEE